jgi:hypothetical protein
MRMRGNITKSTSGILPCVASEQKQRPDIFWTKQCVWNFPPIPDIVTFGKETPPVITVVAYMYATEQTYVMA